MPDRFCGSRLDGLSNLIQSYCILTTIWWCLGIPRSGPLGVLLVRYILAHVRALTWNWWWFCGCIQLCVTEEPQPQRLGRSKYDILSNEAVGYHASQLRCCRLWQSSGKLLGTEDFLGVTQTVLRRQAGGNYSAIMLPTEDDIGGTSRRKGDTNLDHK